MMLATVQGYIAARLQASPVLVALHAEPILYSALADETEAKDALNTQLHLTGVVFEIGMPELAQLENLASGGLMAAALVPIFVAESPAKEHSPAWLSLVDAVIDAVCDSSADPGGVRVISAAAPIQEGGYVLHEIIVAVPTIHGG
jgi:hypothetical protein